MNNTICAVIVTYNRKKLLLECLVSLLKQTRALQGVYLVDNASTDGTPELLMEKGLIGTLPPVNLKEPWERSLKVSNHTDKNPIELHYLRMPENTGGAGGFYEGVRRGYVKGYHWLWMMDDDAEPSIDALEILCQKMSEEITALAGTVVLPDNRIAENHRGTINFKRVFPAMQKPLPLLLYNQTAVKIDMSSFVGLLIRRDIVVKIGFPAREFFIYHDDVDYCIRVRKVGEILLIPASVIKHKELSGNLISKSFLKVKSFRIPFRRFWLQYYYLRNLIWLGKKHSTNRVMFYVSLILYLTKLLIGIILYDDNKIKRIRLVLNSYIDGLKGLFDNSRPQKILYF